MLRKMFRNDLPVFDSTNYRPERAKACAEAGVGTWDAKTRTRTGVRIHDCRCSGAINLLDSGVHESLVLQIGGWKTRAMLDGYNRPDINRIRAAMKQSGEYVAARMKAAKFGSANGNRTRILALKGLRANRCTIAPPGLQCGTHTRIGKIERMHKRLRAAGRVQDTRGSPTRRITPRSAQLPAATEPLPQ